MNKLEISSLVKLYRALGKPNVDVYDFECEIVLEEYIYLILREFYLSVDSTDSNSSSVAIEAENYEIRDKEEFDSDNSSILGQSVTIFVSLSQNDIVRFYKSSEEFFKSNYSNTDFRELESYYLIDEDYLHGADEISQRPQSMAILDEVSFFISKIKEFSDTFDARGPVAKATFFLSDSDDKDRVRPFDIYLEINKSLMELTPESFTILKDMSDKDFERNMLLKNALCEVFSSVQHSVNHIAFFFDNWSKVEEAYFNNYDVYIRGISFSKLRQEVEERHLKYHDDVSSSLIDISLKISILPTTFSIWLFFVRSDSSPLKNFGFLMALFAMACLFSYVLSSQKNKLNYLKGSVQKQVDIFLKQFRESKKDFEIKSTIESEITSLATDVGTKIDKAGRWVIFGYIVIWLPVIVVLVTSLYSWLYPVVEQDLFSCGVLLTS